MIVITKLQSVRIIPEIKWINMVLKTKGEKSQLGAHKTQ